MRDWFTEIIEATTFEELQAVLTDIRSAALPEADYCNLYTAHSLAERVLKQPDRTYLAAALLEKRKPLPPLGKPITCEEAKAIREEYPDALEYWDRFYFWVDRQLDAGATTEFIDECLKQIEAFAP